jgi:hypothetical protein
MGSSKDHSGEGRARVPSERHVTPSNTDSEHHRFKEIFDVQLTQLCTRRRPLR